MISTTDIGRIGEAKVISKLVEMGYYPYIDISGKSPVDIIALKDGKTLKINVKSTCSIINGSYQVSIKSTRHNNLGNRIINFDKSKFDYLGAYLMPIDTVVFIPCESIKSKTLICMSNTKGVNKNFIGDYLLID